MVVIRAPNRGSLKKNVSVSQTEEPLAGTNATPVVRVGDTLRRPKKPSSDAVQLVLGRLRDAGFTGCPEPRGFDDQGREIWSHVSGDGGTVPLRPETVTDVALTGLGRLIRSFHDASVGIAASQYAWDSQLSDPSGLTEVLCHNDLSIPNTVFRGEQPIALIDWDFAAPGRRLWDLSYAVWWMVPLHRPECMRSIGWPDIDQARRLALFLDAYGLDDGRAELLDVVYQRQRCNQEQLASWVAAGRIPAFDPFDPAIECGRTEYVEGIRPELERALGL
jgi:hypothetical protein